MSATTLAPAPPARTRPGVLLWGALGIVYLVWGSTYLAIRVVVETMPPLLSAGTRFLVAAAVLAAVIAVRKGVGALRVDRRALLAAALVGTLLLAGGNGGVTVAEVWIPSSLAALLVAAVPLWVVLLRSGNGDRPSRRTVVGVLLGFAGLAVLLRPGIGDGTVLVGSLIVLAASASWAVGSYWSSRLPVPRDPFVATVWEMVGGGVVLLTIALVRGEAARLNLGEVSTRSWLALGYLVVFGSLVAFTAYVWLLQNAPISLVATYAYVNPVVAVILGAALLAEPVTAAIIVGGAIVVAGVGVVVSTERPRPSVTSECEPAG
jgi:drug/metabolite transporter (DMT)-like permease